MFVATSIAPATASAQFEAIDKGISVGQWTFYPSIEARVRGEYRRAPVDVGGDAYERTAVQSDAFGGRTPGVVASNPAVADQWMVAERARLGMGVAFDVLTAQITLQDSRALGATPGGVDGGGFGGFSPYEAYLDVRTEIEDPVFSARVGRQRVHWGDGRLLGGADWSPRPHALDAATLRFSMGDVVVQALGALVALPGPVGAPLAPYGESVEGTGAQIYGLNARWAVLPLLQLEAVGLARIARDPLPRQLTRGDTYTVDLRVSGEEHGVSYAVEGAYQLGRIAGFGVNHDIGAFAAAGRFAWQSALPWKLRVGAHGGYASGDSDPGEGTFSRFDPILPTVHEHHGLMDLYAWSNMFDAGGDIAVSPDDAVKISAGYSFVGLAEKTDRWSNAYLVPVGADADNTSASLGHEVDLVIAVEPWEWGSFSAGYGVMILGDGGRNIMASANRFDSDLLHYGLLQAEIKAP